jgi:hypothetical protein
MNQNRPRIPAAERFWAQVEITEGCWLWSAYVDPSGYGKFTAVVGVSVYAHRWSYEFLVGPIPDGLVIDHLCRVRNCVNPDHLEPVTSAENTRRGIHPRRFKINCLRGHPLSGDNVLVSGGTRYCRTCIRLRKREQRGRPPLRPCVACGAPSEGTRCEAHLDFKGSRGRGRNRTAA